MKDMSDKRAPPFDFNYETGHLSIDKGGLNFDELPYAVRLLLTTYMESKDLIEHLTEVTDELNEIQQSSN